MGMHRSRVLGVVLAMASSASAAPPRFAGDVRVPLPAEGRALAVADVDADGRLDLAALDVNGGVTAWLGASEAARQEASASPGRLVQSSLQLPTPGIVRAGDFDGDGNVDLLVSSAAGSGPCSATLLRGAGDGSFAVGSTLAISAASHAGCAGLETADFDGDGNLDVALVYVYQPPDTNNGLNGGVQIWLNRGAGVFEQGETHELSAPNGLPYYSHALALMDLDADAALDLVFAAEVRWLSGPTSWRLQSLRGDGTGHFSEGPRLDFDCRDCDLVAARGGDLTGDGLDDVVVSAQSAYDYAPGEFPILLFANDGAGGFAEPQSLGVASGVAGLELADVSGSAIADVVLFRDGIISVLQGGDGGARPAFGPADDLLSNTGGVALLADLDADGQLDLASADGLGLRVIAGRRRGPAFGLPPLLRLPSAYTSIDSLADVDGDGSLDVLAASYGRVDVLANAGAGRFVAGVSVPMAADAWRVPAADVDADGLVDLVLPSAQGFAVARGLPGQGFDAPPVDPAAQYRYIQASAWGDVDGDGDGDLLVFESSGANVVDVYLQAGDHQLPRVRGLPMDVYVSDLNLGDVNGDGALDLIVADWGGGVDAITGLPNPSHTSIWLGDGQGNFDRAGELDARGKQRLGDLNADGALDLITQQAAFLGHGDGSFDAARPLPITGEASDFELADFDGDGHLDLAYHDARSLLVAAGDGSGSFGTSVVLVPASELTGLVAADLGGNSLPDLMTTRLTYLELGEASDLFLLINQSPSCGPAAPR